MKKVYKTDLGSLLFVGFGVFIFLVLTLSVCFMFGGAPLKVKLSGIGLTVFGSVFLFLILKYEVIITDEAIHAKILSLSFLKKYQTMQFNEIMEVWNAIGPFSDMQNIIFKSRDQSKKLLSISVGFGIPWQALFDILERLPKNTKITFEPLLWKRIQHPPKPDTPRRLFITAVILLLIIAAGFLYAWWNAFIRR